MIDLAYVIDVEDSVYGFQSNLQFVFLQASYRQPLGAGVHNGTNRTDGQWVRSYLTLPRLSVNTLITKYFLKILLGDTESNNVAKADAMVCDLSGRFEYCWVAAAAQGYRIVNWQVIECGWRWYGNIL